jgi:hypothetical protein
LDVHVHAWGQWSNSKITTVPAKEPARTEPAATGHHLPGPAIGPALRLCGERADAWTV